MISRASSARRPLPAWGRLVAFHSGAIAGPTPKAGSSRPPLRKSIVAHCFASTSGSRKLTTVTFMPNLSRSVAPASAAITLIDSSCGSADTRRSVCHSESRSLASQRSMKRQNARASANGSWASPSPTRIFTASPPCAAWRARTLAPVATVVEQRRQPPRRLGGRDLRRHHLGLQLGQQPADVVAAAEALLQPVAQHRDEPLLLLLAPPRRQLAGRAQTPAVVLDRRPHLVHAPALERAHREHGRIPVRAHVPEEVQRGAVLGRRALRARDVVAVPLVDRERIGELEDALLDALELVPRAGKHQHEEEVDHRRDRDLGLADADRLDQHDVVARRLAHEDGLARPPRDAAEGAAGWARPDERLRRHRQTRHARLVPEDAAAGARARRIDRQHRDALLLRDQVEPEGLDERALPRTRDAGHAHPDRATRLRQDLLEEPLRLRLIVGARALDQRDRLGQRAAIAASQVGRELHHAPRLRLGAKREASVGRPVNPTTAVPRLAKPARQPLGHRRPDCSPPTSISFPFPARLPRRLRRSRHDTRTVQDVARSLPVRPETKSRVAIDSRTPRAGFGPLVPGPKIALTPACSSIR